jgi:hypothetical protein
MLVAECPSNESDVIQLTSWADVRIGHRHYSSTATDADGCFIPFGLSTVVPLSFPVWCDSIRITFTFPWMSRPACTALRPSQKGTSFLNGKIMAPPPLEGQHPWTTPTADTHGEVLLDRIEGKENNTLHGQKATSTTWGEGRAGLMETPVARWGRHVLLVKYQSGELQYSTSAVAAVWSLLVDP